MAGLLQLFAQGQDFVVESGILSGQITLSLKSEGSVCRHQPCVKGLISGF